MLTLKEIKSKTENKKLNLSSSENDVNQFMHEIALLRYINSIKSYARRLKLIAGNTRDAGITRSGLNNGITLTQFINGCSDYVLNSYVHLKLVLTEEEPVIRPYLKERWIELADTKTFSYADSINLIEVINSKIILLINNLERKDFTRKYFDPSVNKTKTIKDFLKEYIKELNLHIIKIRKKNRQ